MKNWYVVRTAPGAQRPSIQNPLVSNIVRSLERSGFEVYLPIEIREQVHHRSKAIIEKRFPLLPGYAFVADPHDWVKLEECDGVADVIRINDVPKPIATIEIDRLREAETKIFLDYQRQRQNRIERDRLKRESENGISLRKATQLYPAGSPVIVRNSHALLGGMKAIVTAATGRQTVKAVIETINGMLNAEFSIADLEIAA